MKTKDIEQEVHFEASPTSVYHALMDSDKHSEFTGASADIVPRTGGHFSAFDGYITGQNLELIPGKKIVQSWHAAEEFWPDDHYSKVVFNLIDENGGTTIKFRQEGIPVEHAEEIAKGWEEYYWAPMREMLEH
jgi:activator of HSP90 ATPase